MPRRLRPLGRRLEEEPQHRHGPVDGWWDGLSKRQTTTMVQVLKRSAAVSAIGLWSLDQPSHGPLHQKCLRLSKSMCFRLSKSKCFAMPKLNTSEWKEV